MPTMEQAAEEFLKRKTLAVAGVSRKGNAVGNLIFKKLKETGHQVYLLNPHAEEVEGVKSYARPQEVPEPLEGVVIATSPENAEIVARDCAAAGVKRVWLHRSIGRGSTSEKAVEICREHGITVIPAGCPMMYCKPVDKPHRCLCWALKLFGKLPREV